jgi:hypothetical protein
MNYLPEVSVKKELRNGRSLHDGYQRGWGMQFSDLRAKVLDDPLYQEALLCAGGRSVMAELNRMNIFLILKYYISSLVGEIGNIIEFGSYKGGNALFMAYVVKNLYPEVKVFALDTYEGMPKTDKELDLHSEGDFSGVDLDELARIAKANNLDNLYFVKGLFEDTASNIVVNNGLFSLAHIDCDIAGAVKYSYEIVKDSMQKGGYLIFDDATVSSCLGATEVVEEVLIKRDNKNCEQIFPHYVFRA